MTKKHYTAIARAIHGNSTTAEDAKELHGKNISVILRTDLIEELSEIFAEDNSNFDENRFIDACINEEIKKETS